MRSIRRDLALKMGIAALFILLVGGFGLYFSLRKALATQFENTLATKAQALVMASEIDDGEVEIDIDVQAFAGFGSNAPGDYFEIFGPDGTSMLRSPSLGSAHLDPPGGFFELDRGFATVTLPEKVSGRAHWTISSISFEDEDDEVNPPPQFRILVASTDSTLRRTLRTVALFTALFGLCGILAILAIQGAAVRSALRPLDRLTQEIQHISVRHLGRRLRLDDVPAELRGMPAKFNELLQRLEASFNRERRFTSNAAHELRTPVAELRVMSELVTQWPEEFSREQGEEMLEVLDEIESLLESLSVLARTESGSSRTRETLDLDSEVCGLVDRYRSEAESRSLAIDLDIESGSIETDPILWRAIVQNLVGNAVAHAPEATGVRIAVSPRGIEVENDAPELEAADLPRLFERFWRKSASRSDTDHSGLGLSIVRAATEHLEGAARAELDGERLRVEATWEANGSASLPS